MAARDYTTRHPERVDQEALEQIKIMVPHFFGDSILMACPLHNKDSLCTYFDCLTFIITIVVARALDLGILLRGAVSHRGVH